MFVLTIAPYGPSLIFLQEDFHPNLIKPLFMSALIDLQHFRQVSLQDTAFAQEIIERFLVQAEIYQAKLDIAIKQQDFRSIKSTMQQLKSQAMVFGANRLVQLIKRIEMANLDRYEQFKPVVDEAYQLFIAFLEEVRNTQTKLASKL